MGRSLPAQLLLCACVFLAAAARLPAQEPAPRAITGVLLDTVTNTPIPRGSVCLRPIGRCVSVDSLGAFRIAPLPIGRLTAVASCRKSQFLGLILDSAVVDLGPGDTREVRFMVDGTDCDRRPLRTTHGDFVGHYTNGFEVSHFSACDASVSMAWVDIPDSVAVRWPEDADDNVTSSTVFVRWRGRLTGPGGYGHLSGYEYELVVDSIYEMRGPRPDDCRGLPQ